MESPYSIFYKLINDEIFYWQQLEESKTSVTIYKGKVGELGETVVFRNRIFSSYRKKLYNEIHEITANGYRGLEEEDYTYVDIEFDLKSNNYDINSQRYLEIKKFIENILVNTGLGFTIFDEFEMYDDGILEITCQVVNARLAIEVLEKALKDTKFSDYRKIYENDFR
jgi:signal peptidase I